MRGASETKNRIPIYNFMLIMGNYFKFTKKQRKDLTQSLSKYIKSNKMEGGVKAEKIIDKVEKRLEEQCMLLTGRSLN